MTNEPQNKYLDFYMDTDDLIKALNNCDLGDGRKALVRQYPHKDMLHKLTHVIEKSAYDELAAKCKELEDWVHRATDKLCEGEEVERELRIDLKIAHEHFDKMLANFDGALAKVEKYEAALKSIRDYWSVSEPKSSAIAREALADGNE